MLSLFFPKIIQFFLGVDCGVHPPPPGYDNFLSPLLPGLGQIKNQRQPLDDISDVPHFFTKKMSHYEPKKDEDLSSRTASVTCEVFLFNFDQL